MPASVPTFTPAFTPIPTPTLAPLLVPEPLQKGDKVGLICPASPTDSASIEQAKANITTLGFIPVLGKSVHDSARFLAGSDKDRAADINNFFADDDIKAIFIVRGGYGCSRLLHLIDYDLIARKPKFFIGISDTTVLQNALLAKTGLISLTGMAAKRPLAPKTTRSLTQCLNRRKLTFRNIAFGKEGNADGLLIGGCMSVFAGLIGTDFMPPLQGSVLLLEDIAEEPYRIDGMLQHFMNAKVFEQVSAVIFGTFYKCTAKDKADGTVAQVIDEYCKLLPVPVIKDFNYGHQPNSYVLPLGATARINGSTASLSISF